MKNNRPKGRSYLVISYIFVGLFAALIVYMAYFQITQSKELLESPYNRRQDKLAENTLRGSILSSDGYTLAYTETDEEGNETRIYPFNEMFAQTVGYSDYGSAGLEAAENYELLTSSEDAASQIAQGLNNEKQYGDSVVTSLNVTLQSAAFNALGDRKGAVIVLDASTAKVLACVSKPDFDPNTVYDDWEALNADDSGSPFINRALQGRYEPGSTFKLITALAYMRQDASWQDFTYECTGEITRGGYTVHCMNGSVHGVQSLEDALANSCNCAFSYIAADLLDSGALFEAASDVLFNEAFSLGLPSVRSSFSLEMAYSDGLTMQTAIGQGDTLITPIHLAMITQSIYNHGVMLKPSFIEKVINHSGNTVRTEGIQSYGSVMSGAEADALKALMHGVVDYGTATSLADLSCNVAGKTGTAEYSNSEGYSHSWFTGFSNTGKNDIVVAVIIEEAAAGESPAKDVAQAVFEAAFPTE